jgi:ABC-type dipeptide/oligopeptide/nickel transport system permease subunit
MSTTEHALPSPLAVRRSRTRESLLLTAAVRLLRNPQGLVGIAGLALLVVLAVFAGPLSGHDPIAQDAARRFLPPSLDHPFGTDELRRDLFARTLYGLRTSLLIALLAVSVGATAGIALGFLAGYAGGWMETISMRAVDAMLAFPALLGAMAIVTILGPSARSVGIAIAVFSSPAFVRLARAQMLAEKHKDYVRAAQALGVGPVRIVFRHIALNALPPLLTQVALAMAAAVLVEAALSFLGLGQRPPAPSLGGLINASKTHLRTAWWYAFCPGAVLAVLLLCLNLLADAVNEASSPYVRRKV